LTRESDRQFLDYIILAIRGKKFAFGKVLKQIDDMVQADNDKKKYCGMHLDPADDNKKVLERSEDKLEAAIAQKKETTATLSEEIAALIRESGRQFIDCIILAIRGKNFAFENVFKKQIDDMVQADNDKKKYAIGIQLLKPKASRPSNKRNC